MTHTAGDPAGQARAVREPLPPPFGMAQIAEVDASQAQALQMDVAGEVNSAAERKLQPFLVARVTLRVLQPIR